MPNHPTPENAPTTPGKQHNHEKEQSRPNYHDMKTLTPIKTKTSHYPITSKTDTPRGYCAPTPVSRNRTPNTRTPRKTPHNLTKPKTRAFLHRPAQPAKQARKRPTPQNSQQPRKRAHTTTPAHSTSKRPTPENARANEYPITENTPNRAQEKRAPKNTNQETRRYKHFPAHQHARQPNVPAPIARKHAKTPASQQSHLISHTRARQLLPMKTRTIKTPTRQSH